jgi:hypothetical protein
VAGRWAVVCFCLFSLGGAVNAKDFDRHVMVILLIHAPTWGLLMTEFSRQAAGYERSQAILGLALAVGIVSVATSWWYIWKVVVR